MPIAIAKDEVRAPLFVVVPYYNPYRSVRRHHNAARALEHFHNGGAVITLVEIAYGDREHVFADSGLHGKRARCEKTDLCHRYIPLRTKDELWLKENAINVGVQSLPADWEYVYWPDADITHVRANWASAIIQKLQHHPFVQSFSMAADVGPNYEILPDSIAPSFAAMYRDGLLDKADNYDSPGSVPWPGWPGLGWACTRKAWDAVGGLIDWAVWGGGDYDMAFALIERASEIHGEAHVNYRNLLAEWEDRSRWNIRRNVGVVDGLVLHHWHGQKHQRRYTSKRNLMWKTRFDPLRHLKRDAQGLYQMHDDGSENFVNFRDTSRRIAAARREDSTEV